MLELLYAAGLRVSELAGLDLADVNLSGRMVRVLGKGGKQRLVPFNGAAAAAIRQWLGDREPLSAIEDSLARLARLTRDWTAADFEGPRLPAQLEKVQVLFNGRDLTGWHGMAHFDPYKLEALSPEDRENAAVWVGALWDAYKADVAAAREGSEAIAIFREARERGMPFDVVLLDLNLPGMDGLETMKILRDHDPEVACIVVTAYGSIRSAVDAIRANAPSVETIVVTGGFGRGEGTPVVRDGVRAPANDYDLLATGHGAPALDGMGDALAREFGMDFVDLPPVTPTPTQLRRSLSCSPAGLRGGSSFSRIAPALWITVVTSAWCATSAAASRVARASPRSTAMDFTFGEFTAAGLRASTNTS